MYKMLNIVKNYLTELKSSKLLKVLLKHYLINIAIPKISSNILVRSLTKGLL